MTGLNPLRTKVLITTDEVMFHAPTDNNPDVRYILQSILVAELRFIKPALGAALYDSLCDTKNVLVEESNKVALEALINDGRPTDREQLKLVVGDYVNSTDYLSNSEKKLWHTHLHKIIAECVYFCALPTNHSRFTTKGVVQDNPKSQVGSGGSTTIDLKDLKHLMDRALEDRVFPLLEAMHQYMCAEKYSGYLRDCGCDSSGNVLHPRKTEIILSMYEDDDNCKCKW